MAVRGAAIAALSTAACGLPAAYGAAFALPTDGGTIVGTVQVVTDIGENTLLDIEWRTSFSGLLSFCCFRARSKSLLQ